MKLFLLTLMLIAGTVNAADISVENKHKLIDASITFATCLALSDGLTHQQLANGGTEPYQDLADDIIASSYANGAQAAVQGEDRAEVLSLLNSLADETAKEEHLSTQAARYCKDSVIEAFTIGFDNP